MSSFGRSSLFFFFVEVSCGSSFASGEFCLLPFSSAPAYCPESADVEAKAGDGNREMKGTFERSKVTAVNCNVNKRHMDEKNRSRS